jgi:hypothetical protein
MIHRDEDSAEIHAACGIAEWKAFEDWKPEWPALKTLLEQIKILEDKHRPTFARKKEFDKAIRENTKKQEQDMSDADRKLAQAELKRLTNAREEFMKPHISDMNSLKELRENMKKVLGPYYNRPMFFWPRYLVGS